MINLICIETLNSIELDILSATTIQGLSDAKDRVDGAEFIFSREQSMELLDLVSTSYQCINMG